MIQQMENYTSELQKALKAMWSKYCISKGKEKGLHVATDKTVTPQQQRYSGNTSRMRLGPE